MIQTQLTERPGVLIGIASIPERAQSLERVVAALAPQADRIVVSLNGYARPPAYHSRFRNVVWEVRGRGNGGDAEKFAAVDDFDGYVLTADDDILYPADYVETMIARIERYDRRRLVSFHGGTTNGYSAKAHGAATVKRLRCLGTVASDDLDVNALGTGVLGWHTARIPIWRDIFRTPNMADVYLASHARTFGIPLAVLAHQEGWLRDIQPPGTSIYESNRAGDGSSCDTRRERKLELDHHTWTTPPPTRPCVRVTVTTCSRPELLGELLLDLDREAGWVDLDVHVYEDPTDADYSLAREFCETQGWSWHRLDERKGRDGYPEIVSQQFADAQTSAAEWFVFLPDDVRLVRHAIPRAIATWARLDNPTALTLWRLKEHEGQPNWTGRRPQQRDGHFEIFHLDGLYLCRRDLLEFFEYRCPTVERRPGRTSSGVGRAMSIALHRDRRRLYRVERSLARPVPGTKSVMNPDATDRRYPGVCL